MNKTLKLKTFIVAIVALLAMLVSAVFVAMPLVARAEDVQVATLVYEDEAHTVVTGIKEDASGFNVDADFTVTIPASVTEIDMAAFSNKNKLVAVTFEQGSALKAIGDFAFAQTGITEIKLPNGLETIGAAAFTQTKLKSVALPASVTEVGQRAFDNMASTLAVTVANANATFGTSAFDRDSYVIAENRAAYNALVANPALADCKGAITFPVTIEYSLKGHVIATEKRLYGKGYGVELVDGVWTATDKATLGTQTTTGMTWYAKADGTGDALDADKVSALLGAESFDGDTITLYATGKGAGKAYFALDNIVYNGKSYALNGELNSLLEKDISDEISSAMTVSMVSYTDAYGVAAETLPNAVCNAGHYVLKVSDGGVEYPLEIDVARREVNIGEMSVLSWKLTSVNATPTVTELLNATGINLYVYQRNDGSGEYPSRTILSDAEKTDMDLSDSYTPRFVRHSVVRYRGVNVTVGISGGSLDTYYEITSIDSEKTSSAREVGAYTAAVTVTALDNYAFARNIVPTDNVARGIRITVSEDGRTAYVEKDWYIVNESNMLVGEDGEDYVISNRVYGDDSPVVMPTLMYGDVDSVDYGAEGDPISLTLMRGSETVGGTFTRRELYYYINDSMPAGNYQLRVHAQDVVANEIAHVGFDDIISFTVDKRDINTVMTDRIDKVLKDKEFTYEFDGSAHLYNDEAAEIIVDALGNYPATVSRHGTVWESSVYDDMFGEYEITFNLARMLSDEYYSANSLPIKTSDPDRYTVYYKVSAPNYYDSTEIDGAVRTECKFDVVNVMAVAQPVLRDLAYTGNTLVADIADTVIYTVTKNAGGVDVGAYEVELTLVNPEFYMWQGQTIETKTATETVSFNILAANNRWAVEPGVTFWVEGKYDVEENSVYGSALFGNTVIVITDDKNNVVYNSADGTNKLAGLSAGSYRLSATVAATANYDALSFSIFISVFDRQLLPWWGILLVAIGALAVAALIILILWKKGVFQLLTGKLVLAIRTKATIDATIAAVRASKIAEASRASVAEAEARDRAQERAVARKAAQEAERAKSTDEKVAELEAKAQSEIERADSIKAKAEAMQAKAAAMKNAAAEAESVAEEPEKKAPKKKSAKKAEAEPPKSDDSAEAPAEDSKPTEE